MKASEILKEEFKKEGLEIVEETLKKAYEVLESKVIPRIALEAEEEKLKAWAPGIGMGLSAMKPVLFPIIEKINPAD